MDVINPAWIIHDRDVVTAKIDKHNFEIARGFLVREIEDLRRQQTKRAKNLILALELSKALLDDEIESAQWTIDHHV